MNIPSVTTQELPMAVSSGVNSVLITPSFFLLLLLFFFLNKKFHFGMWSH